jgi:hypothetical protein
MRLAGGAAAGVSEIAADERAILYPTAARRLPDGSGWVVPVHGRIWRPAQGRAAKAALRLALRTGFGVSPDAVNRTLFDERCALMLGDNRDDRHVTVTAAGRAFDLGPTGRDGQFRGELTLSASEVAAQSRDATLEIALRLLPGDPRAIRGIARLVEPTGISVISDIDDTVKVTHVGDRRRMMALTFLEAYEPVEGMAARYQGWCRSGAVFHYVSSSPWTLYEPIADFLAGAGFPEATYTLKNVGLKDRSIRHFLSKATKTKPPAIAALLDAFPRRRFVLVGDNVERDPEIYAGLARAHPGQVAAILIRLASTRPKSLERMHAALAGPGLEGVSCRLFSRADDLPDLAELAGSPAAAPR